MNTKVFQLTKLALMVGVAGFALNSHAIYNLYKKDGLTLDINGQIDMQATKQDTKHEITGDEDGNDWYRANGRPYRDVMPSVKNASDKKPRLGQTHGVSYVEFRASQVLPNDWRATGSIGLGYSDARDMYLSNSSLSLDKKNIGAITLGRQYLHTNYVNRTGTDTPLDIFSTSAVRLDYYGVKGLQASAYYSFSGINDVDEDDNSGLKSGYGASVSYRHLFNDSGNHYLRFGLGYTQNEANPAYSELEFNGYKYGWVDNTLNRYAAETQGVAGSLEYQVGKFLVAADVGRKKETMSKDERTSLDTKTSNYLGAKVAYDINPVFKVSAGYGTKKAKTKLKATAEALTTNLDNLYYGYSYVDGDDIYLFDKADTKEAYVQLDYRVRPNVRIYTRYDTEETKFKVADKEVSKLTDDNIRAGIVFTF